MEILQVNLHNDLFAEHIALYKTRQRPSMRGGDVHYYYVLLFPDGVSYL